MLLQTDPCSLEHVCLNINQFCHFGCWNVNSILHDLCSQYLLLLPRSNAYWGLMGRRAPHQTPRKLTARVSLGAQLSAKISWSTQLNRCVHQLVQFINKITNLYKFTVVFNLAGFNLMKPDHWHTPWGSLKRALEPLCSLLRGMPLLASMRFRMLWWWTHSTGVFRWGCDKTRGAKMCKNGRGGIWIYVALYGLNIRLSTYSNWIEDSLQKHFCLAEMTNLESKTPGWEFVDSIEHLTNMSKHRRVWHGDTLVGNMGYDSIL